MGDRNDNLGRDRILDRSNDRTKEPAIEPAIEPATDRATDRAIDLQQVSHRMGDRLILQNLNVRLTERRIGIVGSNGSGKSTFARLLNGLLIPDQGQVYIDGWNTRTALKAIRRRVGFVFQNPDHQIVLPIVEEDLAFGLKPLKRSKSEIALQVNAILQRYHLDHLRHQPTHTLSGGEKQLLALAAVLITDPRYVVLDEPTTLLDRRNRNCIRQVLHTLDQSIIVISHDLDLLQDFDRILVFEAGQVMIDDRPDVALRHYVQFIDAIH